MSSFFFLRPDLSFLSRVGLLLVRTEYYSSIQKESLSTTSVWAYSFFFFFSMNVLEN